MVAHGVAVDKGVELQLLLVVEDHLQELPVRVAGVSVSQNLDGQDGHYYIRILLYVGIGIRIRIKDCDLLVLKDLRLLCSSLLSVLLQSLNLDQVV